MKKRLFLHAATALLALAASASTLAASLSVSSGSLADNQPIALTFIGSDASCGNGQNIAPQVSWANVPAGTRSVAVLLFDPDGAKGLGVTHWVAYNIDPARGQLRQGEAATGVEGVTVGNNSSGAAAYKGLCPPAGDHPHHYVLTVIATDLPPGTLPAGLGRDELLARLKGHGLAGQSVVGTYGH
ncbi:YbhB/YbcL family Raf kinase inhibitor-like protein [Pseudomonas sp. HR96]|uniref:YbhB/YbcL family Raf kinase inhibitor-like protein n=1 Tax=Pseudomonas sp. HR96 TaxID=1027966 RepID=UPI002A757074|nr:YbhB/YbcL family Raf kinase inhibitor-like protein [Pseudomonas sp. HR96]WPO98259.1 YbhB/YbcL family Raf kinase inhibitor-like protein [Pseudomonas sp. HR96]